MKIEVNLRWLAVFVSILIMIALRNHRIWLIVYAVFALSITAGWALILPRLSKNRYETLRLLALQAQTNSEIMELDHQLKQARWLRYSPHAYGFFEVRGLLDHRRTHFSKAILAWTEALKTAPVEFHERIRINIARSYLQLEDFDSATSHFQYVLSLDPYSMLARDGLAEAMEGQRSDRERNRTTLDRSEDSET